MDSPATAASTAPEPAPTRPATPTTTPRWRSRFRRWAVGLHGARLLAFVVLVLPAALLLVSLGTLAAVAGHDAAVAVRSGEYREGPRYIEVGGVLYHGRSPLTAERRLELRRVVDSLQASGWSQLEIEQELQSADSLEWASVQPRAVLERWARQRYLGWTLLAVGAGAVGLTLTMLWLWLGTRARPICEGRSRYQAR